MLKKIGYIINLLSIISIVILNAKLISMGILPSKYLIIFIGLAVVTIILLITLIKLKSKIGIIAISITNLIIICFSILGYIEINKINKFFNGLTNKNYELTEYYVLVLKDSKYNNISDLESKSIGVITIEDEVFKNVRTNLYNLIMFDEIEFEDEEKGLDSLGNKKIEALLISDSNYEILKDEEVINEENYKIIHTISLKVNIENIKADKDMTKESFNIYISGSDSRLGVVTRSRSDVNIVITVNPKTHEVLITSIPRDYYVQIHGTSGYKDKLTHAGNRGIDTSVKTIEDLLDIDIDYYLKVNFTFAEKLVDLLDGLTIYSDTEFTAYTNRKCSFIKGNNTVDGSCALAFARERYAYKTGDRHRGENQMYIIEKIIEKVSSNKKYLLKYNDIMKALEDNFSTNASIEEIYKMIKYQLSDMPSWKVTSNSLTGSDSREYTYSYKARKLYVMIPYKESISNATKKINEIMNK